jgi:L-amino acid N-acyltransferase YncA
METRLARPADLPSIGRITNAAIERGGETGFTAPLPALHWEAWLEAHRPDRHPVIVALNATTEEVVGYLSLSPYRPGRGILDRTAEVSIFIDAEHHRRGVGKALIAHALALAPALGLDRVLGILLATNRASLAFFERCGFSLWGTFPGVARIEGADVDHRIVGRAIEPPGPGSVADSEDRGHTPPPSDPETGAPGS